MFHAVFIMQRHPCTACVIITSLNLETLVKVHSNRNDFTFEQIIIDNPKELAKIDGVEVENLPIILLDGEQITAGSIMPPKRLNAILDQMY